MNSSRKIAAIISAGIICGSCMGGLQKVKIETLPQKPNIIFILADDLGYGDLSFLGQTKFKTPNIDRLAASGVVFSNHYSGCTVCAPSRSSLFTGQHTGHTFIRGNREHQSEGQEPLPATVVTLAELLKSAGYTTGAFGKWGLGFPGSEGDPNNQGFDEFFGYNCQRLGHNYYPGHLWHNQEQVLLNENNGTATGIYAPQLIHSQAIKFINDNHGKPFFMFYPTVIPHAELVAPEEYMKKFRGELLPEKSYKGYNEGPDYRKGPYGSQSECHAAFAAMVTLLDDQVGEIMATLNELGIAENTLVIFTSDNGPHNEGGADPEYFNSNGPFRGTKRDLYEGGIHVPFVAVWPGRINPAMSNHISAFWDFLPTCTELAGIETPAGIDGISYLPALLGKPNEQKEHEFLYWEFHEQGTKQAVRLGNWKGVKLKQGQPVELYDLSTDLEEKNNVAGINIDIVKNIEKIMVTSRTESEIWPVK